MADPIRDFAAGLSYGFSDEPHPAHPIGATEQEPWCHACSPRITWAQAQTAARILEVLVPALETSNELWHVLALGALEPGVPEHIKRRAHEKADQTREALTQARAIAEGKA